VTRRLINAGLKAAILKRKMVAAQRLKNGFNCKDCKTHVGPSEFSASDMKRRNYRCRRCVLKRQRKSRRNLKKRSPLKWKSRILVVAYKKYGHKIMSVARVIKTISKTITCPYCKQIVPPLEISLDHIIPKSRGGNDSLSNLQYTCLSCNIMKGNLLDDEFRLLLQFLETVSKEMSMAVRRRLRAAGYMYRHGHR